MPVVTDATAPALLGMSPRQFWEAITRQRVPYMRLGQRTVVFFGNLQRQAHQNAACFVMSRLLSKEHWAPYYVAVVCLLVIDGMCCLVSIFVQFDRVIIPWAIQDASLIVGLMLVHGWYKMNKSTALTWRGPLVCLAHVVARTATDYGWGWQFYFPSLPAAACP
jgi:hypothetical protein